MWSTVMVEDPVHIEQEVLRSTDLVEVRILPALLENRKGVVIQLDMHELGQLSNDRFEFSNESNSHVGQHERALIDVADGAALNRVPAKGSNSVADARMPEWES